MKYFLDTEFVEDGVTIELLSIGIVAEDGREFYREVWPVPVEKASSWVKENVLPNLVHLNHGEHVSWDDFPSCPRGSREWIAIGIQEFCAPGRYGQPEFWSYFGDYDWVALCQLFGTMMDLPTDWPMYCRDLKQEIDRLDLGISQDDSNHNALEDAHWIAKAWRLTDIVACERTYPRRIAAYCGHNHNVVNLSESVGFR